MNKLMSVTLSTAVSILIGFSMPSMAADDTHATTTSAKPTTDWKAPYDSVINRVEELASQGIAIQIGAVKHTPKDTEGLLKWMKGIKEYRQKVKEACWAKGKNDASIALSKRIDGVVGSIDDAMRDVKLSVSSVSVDGETKEEKLFIVDGGEVDFEDLDLLRKTYFNEQNNGKKLADSKIKGWKAQAELDKAFSESIWKTARLFAGTAEEGAKLSADSEAVIASLNSNEVEACIFDPQGAISAVASDQTQATEDAATSGNELASNATGVAEEDPGLGGGILDDGGLATGTDPSLGLGDYSDPGLYGNGGLYNDPNQYLQAGLGNFYDKNNNDDEIADLVRQFQDEINDLKRDFINEQEDDALDLGALAALQGQDKGAKAAKAVAPPPPPPPAALPPIAPQVSAGGQGQPYPPGGQQIPPPLPPPPPPPAPPVLGGSTGTDLQQLQALTTVSSAPRFNPNAGPKRLPGRDPLLDAMRAGVYGVRNPMLTGMNPLLGQYGQTYPFGQPWGMTQYNPYQSGAYNGGINNRVSVNLGELLANIPGTNQTATPPGSRPDLRLGRSEAGARIMSRARSIGR